MITRRSSIGTSFVLSLLLLIRRHEDGNPHWLPCRTAHRLRDGRRPWTREHVPARRRLDAERWDSSRRLRIRLSSFTMDSPCRAEDEVAPIHPERDAGEGREAFRSAKPLGSRSLTLSVLGCPAGRACRRWSRLRPRRSGADSEQLQQGIGADQEAAQNRPWLLRGGSVCEALRVYDGSLRP